METIFKQLSLNQMGIINSNYIYYLLVYLFEGQRNGENSHPLDHLSVAYTVQVSLWVACNKPRCYHERNLPGSADSILNRPYSQDLIQN